MAKEGGRQDYYMLCLQDDCGWITETKLHPVLMEIGKRMARLLKTADRKRVKSASLGTFSGGIP